MATKKFVFVSIGMLFVVLGIIALFLPIVPTSPFLLVAAACFARSSQTLYNKLMDNPIFGPAIREWREYGTMAKVTKWISILLIAVSFSLSIALFIPVLTGKVIMGVIGLLVIILLYRIPSRD